jgi:two-component system, sensor histidine kinase and response regulator
VTQSDDERTPDRQNSPTVAETSSSSRDGFPSIPGLDIDRAISFLGEDPVQFRTFLSSFVEEFAGAEQSLREHLGTDNRAGAAKILHALRGAAAYIGADELVASAKSLEIAILENKPFPDSLTNDFERAFKVLMTAAREP